jgi:hypothetical protein
MKIDKILKKLEATILSYDTDFNKPIFISLSNPQQLIETANFPNDLTTFLTRYDLKSLKTPGTSDKFKFFDAEKIVKKHNQLQKKSKIWQNNWLPFAKSTYGDMYLYLEIKDNNIYEVKAYDLDFEAKGVTPRYVSDNLINFFAILECWIRYTSLSSEHFKFSELTKEGKKLMQQEIVAIDPNALKDSFWSTGSAFDYKKQKWEDISKY